MTRRIASAFAVATVVAAAAMAGGAPALAATHEATATTAHSFYLSPGDSLAQGCSPTPPGTRAAPLRCARPRCGALPREAPPGQARATLTRTSGRSSFSYQTEQFHQAGSVSPLSRTLKPGQTAMFTVMVTAGQAGDEALTLHLGTGSGNDGSIPVIVRSLVPLSPSGGSFSGSLTGGGANGNAGQEFTYQFNVMGNKPSLNVGV
jgi:hypothetical protein